MGAGVEELPGVDLDAGDSFISFSLDEYVNVGGAFSIEVVEGRH